MYILILPQWSTVVDGVHLLDRDSAFTCTKTQLLAIRKKYPQAHITIAIPEHASVDSYLYVLNDFEHNYEVDSYVRMNYKHPVDDRYLLDLSAIAGYEPDIIFNNIPEIARNLRCLYRGLSYKLISFHHFPDHLDEGNLVNWEGGANFAYFWRQLDGAICSDGNVFNMNCTMQGFVDNVKDKLGIEIDATYISYLRTSDFYSSGTKKFKRRTAIFGNRITGSHYSNWLHAFKLFQNKEDCGDIRVIFTNPTGAKGLAELDKIPAYFTISEDEFGFKYRSYFDGRIIVPLEGVSKQTYYNLCMKSHYTFSLFSDERFGGLTVRESVLLGANIPVTLNVHQFSNWYKGIEINTIDSIDELQKGFLPYLESIGWSEETSIISNILDEDELNHINNLINLI